MTYELNKGAYQPAFPLRRFYRVTDPSVIMFFFSIWPTVALPLNVVVLCVEYFSANKLG